jgi:hypothetical protein
VSQTWCDVITLVAARDWRNIGSAWLNASWECTLTVDDDFYRYSTDLRQAASLASHELLMYTSALATHTG